MRLLLLLFLLLPGALAQLPKGDIKACNSDWGEPFDPATRKGSVKYEICRRAWHVGIQSAPEHFRFPIDNRGFREENWMKQYAWGNPHFFCVNVPQMWYNIRQEVAMDGVDFGKPDNRRWSRFNTPYSLFWIHEEPTSFRWDRRFDFVEETSQSSPSDQTRVKKMIHPVTDPEMLYSEKAERWTERDEIKNNRLFFQVDVTGVKELLDGEDENNPSTWTDDGYLKGWYHLKISLREDGKFSSDYFIDRLVVTARGLYWSVASDGSYHQWALATRNTNDVISYKPRRTWQGGVGEFVYDFPRTVEDGRTPETGQNFTYVRRQFMPCASAQPTQPKIGNNFIYVRAASANHGTKFGGNWPPPEPGENDVIQLYYRLDNSFCNKFVKIDFVVNGVVIHKDMPFSIKNDPIRWRMEGRKPKAGPRRLSYALEVSASTQIVFLKELNSTWLMTDVRKNRENRTWLWEKGLIPVFYENADPIPRHRIKLTNRAKLQPYNRKIEIVDLEDPARGQKSSSFFGAIKEVHEPGVEFFNHAWSFWDLYHLPDDPRNKTKFKKYVKFIKDWVYNNVEVNSWMTADGMLNNHINGVFKIEDMLLYNGTIDNLIAWKSFEEVRKMEDTFFDPVDLPYFDSTPLTTYIVHSKTSTWDTGLPMPTPHPTLGTLIYPNPGQSDIFNEQRLDGVLGRFARYTYALLQRYPVFAGRAAGTWSKTLFYGVEVAPQPCDLFQTDYYVSGTDFTKSQLMYGVGQFHTQIISEREARNMLEDVNAVDPVDGKDKFFNWDVDDAVHQVKLEDPIVFNKYSYAALFSGQWLRDVSGNNDANTALRKRPSNPIATTDPILRILRWWLNQEIKAKKTLNFADVYYKTDRFVEYCDNIKRLFGNQIRTCPQLPPNPSTIIPPEERLLRHNNTNHIILGDYDAGIPDVALSGEPGAPLGPSGDGGPKGPGGPGGFGGEGGPCGPGQSLEPGQFCPPKVNGTPGQPHGPGGLYGPGGFYGPGGPFGPGGPDGPKDETYAAIPPVPKEKLTDEFGEEIGIDIAPPVLSKKQVVTLKIKRKGKLFRTPFALWIWDARVIHGVAMTMITLFVLPINLFFTRYYKETFNESRPYFHHVWYFCHFCGGATLIFMYIYGMWRQVESTDILGVNIEPVSVLHRRVGWTAIIISVFLMVFGGIRHINKLWRAVLVGVHWALGTTVYICVLFCFFTALGIPGSPAAFNDVTEKDYGWDLLTQEAVFWMGFSWIIFDAFMHIWMSLLLRRSDRTMKLTHARKYYPSPIPILSEYYLFDTPGRQCRIHLLRLYIIMAGLVTLIACYSMFVYNPRGRGLGFMSCTHFFNKTTAARRSAFDGVPEHERWIVPYDYCLIYPKKCGGRAGPVPGCDD